MKIYMIKLHYEDRDEYDFQDEERFTKTYDKAKEIFDQMKKREQEDSWITYTDLSQVSFYEDEEDSYTVDDLENSNFYTSISIIQVEVEE